MVDRLEDEQFPIRKRAKLTQTQAERAGAPFRSPTRMIEESKCGISLPLALSLALKCIEMCMWFYCGFASARSETV